MKTSDTTPRPSRRAVFAGAGGLVVSFSLARRLGAQTTTQAGPALPGSLGKTPMLDSWIRIDGDGAITVFTGKAELGQGLKTALAQIAAEGQLLTGSYMDYAMPRAEDAPHFVNASHPVPAKTNPLGAKGCGEAGCAGALPSVMNALVDALSELGIRHIDMPATPERVWQAIRRARAA